MRTHYDHKNKKVVRYLNSLEECIPLTIDALRQDTPVTITKFAETHREMSGMAIGKYSSNLTPYMVEPTNLVNSMDFTEIIFTGPSRLGKSDATINVLYDAVKNNPRDIAIYHMSRDSAQGFSNQDLSKALYVGGDHARPTMLGENLLADNVFEKRFLSGMSILLLWRTVTHLSGKNLPTVFINDYDNGDIVIGGKDDLFELASNRTTTYGKFGCTFAEGSPAFPILDPKFKLTIPHQMPPTKGIGFLYSGGDMRRYYWKCPHCGEAFIPDMNIVHMDYSLPRALMAASASFHCPHCSCILTEDMRYDLNLGGRWIKSGQQWLKSGEIVGEGIKTERASFWLPTFCQPFRSWNKIISGWVDANAAYEEQGEEQKLYSFVTTVLGEPYLWKNMITNDISEQLEQRAWDWGGSKENPIVPDGVRFLMAMIDVQGGQRPCFVVHVFGIDDTSSIYHIDMFKIKYSEVRFVSEGHPELIDPASYPEDWDLIRTKVMDKKYPLGDGSGRLMGIKLTAVDSGGSKSYTDKGTARSVTDAAYQYYRMLRSERRAQSFHLLKGVPRKNDDKTFLTRSISDTNAPSRFAKSIGVPFWTINTNLVKDATWNKMIREDVGGTVEFPIWSPAWLFKQLTAEHRTDDGWVKLNHNDKNEAFDLLCYCVAFLHHPDIHIQTLDFTKPPPWAETWDKNTLIYVQDNDGNAVPQRLTKKKSALETLAELGKANGMT